MIHSAIHAARADAKCVLHTHTLNGVAVSAQKGGRAADLAAVDLRARVARLSRLRRRGAHDDEKPRLVRDLGDKYFLMLRNHGLLTVAPSIPDAFLLMYMFEAACTIQVRAQSGGGELVGDHREDHRGRAGGVAAGDAGARRRARVAGAAAQARSPEPGIRILNIGAARYLPA